ncbi:hypothetical protein U5640_43155 [Streptomyces sp. SS7]|uniref:hypothetical protein n=1 Tax=Streptomyces sp. SS7 TaxID=3108485 RepID=UPI0030ECB1A5
MTVAWDRIGGLAEAHERFLTGARVDSDVRGSVLDSWKRGPPGWSRTGCWFPTAPTWSWTTGSGARPTRCRRTWPRRSPT